MQFLVAFAPIVGALGAVFGFALSIWTLLRVADALKTRSIADVDQQTIGAYKGRVESLEKLVDQIPDLSRRIRVLELEIQRRDLQLQAAAIERQYFDQLVQFLATAEIPDEGRKLVDAIIRRWHDAQEHARNELYNWEVRQGYYDGILGKDRTAAVEVVAGRGG
jgi:hypothetical protein